MTVTIETILLIVLVCVALALIGLVLIQHGKGADAGASFGGGGSQTVFGGAGSGNFLTKSSWILAGVFFVICLALAYIARDKASGGTGIDFSEPKPAVEKVIETDVPQYEGGDEASTQSDIPVVEEAEQAETAEPVVESESKADQALDKAVESLEETVQDTEKAVNQEAAENDGKEAKPESDAPAAN